MNRKTLNPTSAASASSVIRSAKRYLIKLENEGATATPQLDLFQMAAEPEPEPPGEPAPNPVLEALHQTNADNLTPRAALELIYEWKRLAQ